MNDDSVGGITTSPSMTALHNVVSIVAAYVGHNSLRAGDLPELIGSVHSAITLLAGAPFVSVSGHETRNPAVAVKKSVTKDHIICLEDGKTFKSLRRHLSSFHNLTPEAYRAKWGLASDYPMVAPSYSATRSQLAKESGLGQLGRGVETGSNTASGPAAVPKKAGRGRPKKVSGS